ncbi:MAG: SCP2 sterol-binding domain-containing protein [Pseudomonadota bacterium]|jgi:ubiquinone biosynthesis protein UbiJ|nr:SCP2 sterol-binding domain-containing protein [Pseudomonadota bacterium]|tara:strand:+ start:75 stop:656 length:582 start_codon:yes stop_codon:yes gene_type:complete
MKKESTTLSIINRFLSSEKILRSIPDSLFTDLAEKIIKLRIDDISYDIYLELSENSITLSESSDEFDVEIKSSLANYLLFIISRGSSSYSSKIIINGDVDTASKFNSILSDSENIKSIIAKLVGEKKFIFLEKMYGLVSDNIGILSSDMENSIRDYIVFDLDLVPTKDEINNYLNEVDDLNSRTEKLLQKFKK